MNPGGRGRPRLVVLAGIIVMAFAVIGVVNCMSVMGVAIELILLITLVLTRPMAMRLMIMRILVLTIILMVRVTLAGGAWLILCPRQSWLMNGNDDEDVCTLGGLSGAALEKF